MTLSSRFKILNMPLFSFTVIALFSAVIFPLPPTFYFLFTLWNFFQTHFHSVGVILLMQLSLAIWCVLVVELLLLREAYYCLYLSRNMFVGFVLFSISYADRPRSILVTCLPVCRCSSSVSVVWVTWGSKNPLVLSTPGKADTNLLTTAPACMLTSNSTLTTLLSLRDVTYELRLPLFPYLNLVLVMFRSWDLQHVLTCGRLIMKWLNG